MDSSSSAKPPVEVADLYDSPSGQLGPILFGGHLHWGYWDETTRDHDFAQAADRMTRLMIERTTIQADQHFVDLGCGVGHPAQALARARGCRVDGVTISGYQQQEAARRAKEAGLEDRLHFIHGTALQTPRPDAYYDGGWFFESIFHMGQAAALQEASRVLKSGATLVLTDLPILPNTTPDFMDFVAKHIHSSFIDQAEYPALLAKAGFEMVALEDITENVMPWLVPKLKEAISAHRSEAAALIQENLENEIDNWVFLFEYMSENLGYIIVTARKV